MRRLAICLIVLVGVTGCTAQEQAWWRWYDAQRTRPQTCDQAVDTYWPSSSRSWAHHIVWRESRGIATAQNRRSSAAGCFQLMRVHARRFNAVGYSWSDRYNPAANTLAALNLYREAGSGPWS